MARFGAAFGAGALYFVAVFALGFVLGVLRVGVAQPRLGETYAVLIELPLILAAAWWICGYLVARFQVPARASARLVMGAFGFVLLMLAEFGLGWTLTGLNPVMQLGRYLETAALLGLAGQVLFALFPWLRMLRSSSRA